MLHDNDTERIEMIKETIKKIMFQNPKGGAEDLSSPAREEGKRRTQTAIGKTWRRPEERSENNSGRAESRIPASQVGNRHL